MGEGPRLQNFLEADLEKLPHTGRTCPLRRTLLCAIFMAPAHCPNVDKAARSPRHPSPWLLSGRGSVLCHRGRRMYPALPSHPGMERQVRRPAQGRIGLTSPWSLPSAPTRHPRTGATSGASTGPGKQPEGIHQAQPPVPGPPPREQAPSDPGQPLGAPHLGSRDALLAFGAQVPLWPGWSLWGDTEGCPEHPCSGPVTHSPAPDACLRPLARWGLLLQFLGLMDSPHPQRWEAPRPAPTPTPKILTGKPAKPVRPCGERTIRTTPRRGCPHPAHPGVHVPRGLARSPALSVHGSAEPWRKKKEYHVYYDVSHGDPQRVSVKEILPRSLR